MEFIFQRNSPLPAHTQIAEQIKVALLLGNLRPGEMLPSIRDLEKELGLSRNIVRKAYMELEELGILRMIQGKGVMVNKNLKYKEDKEFLQNCEKLVEATRKRCQQMGLIFSSFARFLYQRAVEMEQELPPLLYVDMSSELASERAEQISQMLNVTVHGMSLDGLKELKKTGTLQPGTNIVCNYYRFDEVGKILRGQKVQVIPLRMTLGDETKKKLNQLPAGSKVVFIFDEADQPRLGLILEDYRRAFEEHHLDFVSRSVKDLPRVMKSDDFAEVLVSNRIWQSIGEDIQHAYNVTHPIMEFDPSSIEESKMQLGIIA